MSLAEKEIYKFGHFILDPTERVLSCEGMPLSLTPKAFDTLLCLIRNPGRLLTKDELLKQVWPDTFVEEVNLAVNISVIRKVLRENPQDCRYIATVPGRGYRFVAEVQQSVTHNGNGRVADMSVALLTRSAQEVGSAVPAGENAVVETVTSSSRRSPRGIAVAIALALLFLAIVGLYLRRAEKRAPTPGSASIAVLPFMDLSPGKDQEYFADGLAEELINDLARVPDLKVVGRSSSFQFKGKNEDLRTVGRKLGAANVLEGSIQREGTRVRIRAELIKVEDGFQLWSEIYDRKIDDVFDIEDEIASFCN